MRDTNERREGELLGWCSLPFGDNCQMQFFMASKLLEILFVLSIYNIIFFLSPSWVRRLLQRRLRLKVRKYIEMTIKLKVAAAASFYTGFVFSFSMYEFNFFSFSSHSQLNFKLYGPDSYHVQQQQQLPNASQIFMKCIRSSGFIHLL